MKKIMQQHDYPKGDCFRACLCSITGISPEIVPNFQDRSLGNFDEILDDWRKKSPFQIVFIECDDFRKVLDGCLVIAHGKSPGKDYNHCVVWRDGKIVHDPHPAKIGIEGEPELYTVIVPKSDTMEMFSDFFNADVDDDGKICLNNIDHVKAISRQEHEEFDGKAFLKKIDHIDAIFSQEQENTDE